MITATKLTRNFGKQTVLDAIDLNIERGELFGLICPDCAGKTTFFRLISGLLQPTSGSVTVTKGTAFGFVPQRFSMYEDLSVDENIRLRAKLYGVPAHVALARAGDMLD